MKRDEVWDSKNKEEIRELDLDKLMDQFIARAIDFKHQQPKTKKPKVSKFEGKPGKNEGKSTATGKQNSSSTATPKDPKENANTNTGGTPKRCEYCGYRSHDISDCRFKDYMNQPEYWQKINASATQHFKEINDAKVRQLDSTASGYSSPSPPPREP